jgi:hypothetical protein
LRVFRGILSREVMIASARAREHEQDHSSGSRVTSFSTAFCASAVFASSTRMTLDRDRRLADVPYVVIGDVRHNGTNTFRLREPGRPPERRSCR